jgi:hypothetical protein
VVSTSRNKERNKAQNMLKNDVVACDVEERMLSVELEEGVITARMEERGWEVELMQ